MKPMLRYLPPEVWMDVFVYLFMIRLKLAQMGNRIGNRKFAEYLQCFLHEWGKLTLDRIRFVRNTEPNASTLISWRLNCKEVEFPETGMPENVKNFKELQIYHLDRTVLAFLQKLQPLFQNIMLSLGSFEKKEDFRAVLHQLLPMVNGIRAISCNQHSLVAMHEFLPELLMNTKMLWFCAEYGVVDEETTIPLFVEWLNAGNDGIGPKLCVLFPYYMARQEDYYEHIITEIRNTFMAGITPRSFIVLLIRRCRSDSNQVQQINYPEFNIENARIGQQLTCRNVENGKNHLLPGRYVEICCHPANPTGEANLREWVEKNADWHWNLCLYDKVTNGIINVCQPNCGRPFEMKPMLRYLPTEVWMDVFVYLFMIRTRLAQLGIRIGNRRFAEYLQGFLHEWGRLRLPSLSFVPSNERYGAAKLLSYRQESLEFAQVELPENIRSFSRIQFEYFNIEVLEFLHLLQPLFTNVKLNINAQFEPQFAENMRIILTHLLPMINGIDTIFCGDPLGLDMLTTHFAGALSRAKMFHFYIWAHRDARISNFSVQWLTAPERGPNEPKLLTMFYNFTPKLIYDEILEAIKEQFISANARSTFAIFFAEFDNEMVSEFQIENAQTGELLTGRHKSAEKGWQFSYFEVCRYKIGAEAQLQQWLAENAIWNKEITQVDTNHIGFYRPTVGNIEERWLDALDVGEERDGLIQL